MYCWIIYEMNVGKLVIFSGNNYSLHRIYNYYYPSYFSDPYHFLLGYSLLSSFSI